MYLCREILLKLTFSLIRVGVLLPASQLLFFINLHNWSFSTSNLGSRPSEAPPHDPRSLVGGQVVAEELTPLVALGACAAFQGRARSVGVQMLFLI